MRADPIEGVKTVVVDKAPPELYLIVSALFHKLGPAFAVLLFASIEPVGVAWLRIVAAGAIFALWRRPWRAFAALGRAPRRLLVAWGVVLAVMNPTFYAALERLPLGTVAAIEFLPVILLAVLGVTTPRNAAALALAVTGVWILADARFAGEPVGFVLAFANAGLFALYIVLAHRVARHGAIVGIDGLAVAMVVASLVITPIGGAAVVPVLGEPALLVAGICVGITSSVVPYVSDQLAMARVKRSTYALLVSLQPATAAAVGVLILGQFPAAIEVVGIGLVVAAAAVHRDAEAV